MGPLARVAGPPRSTGEARRAPRRPAPAERPRTLPGGPGGAGPASPPASESRCAVRASGHLEFVKGSRPGRRLILLVISVLPSPAAAGSDIAGRAGTAGPGADPPRRRQSI